MDNKRKGSMTEAYILNYIKKFIAIKQYSPSFREIAEGIGLKSTNTVYNHMHSLKERGKVDFEENKPRTIRLKGA